MLQASLVANGPAQLDAIQAAAPVFGLASGFYNGAQSVTITCATGGASILYTTDGTDPNYSATAQTYSEPIAVTSTKNIKALAVVSGMNRSVLVTSRYVITAAAPSQVIYVDANNTSGTENGTASRPYRTLTAAIAAAANGAWMKVAKGDYNGQLVLNAKNVYMFGGYAGGSSAGYASGTPGDFTNRDYVTNLTRIIGTTTAPNRAAVIYQINCGADTTIDGFTVTGGKHGYYGDGWVTTFTSTLRLYNNIFENMDGTGEDYGVGAWNKVGDAEVVNNIFRNNIGQRGVGFSMSSDSYTCIFDQNQVQDNMGKGDHAGGAVIVAPDSVVSNSLFSGNTIGVGFTGAYGGAGGGLGMWCSPATANMFHFTISYCIFTDNTAIQGTGFMIDEGVSADVDHVLVYGNHLDPVTNRGGAIWVGDDSLGHPSQMNLSYSTIADNLGATAGGGALLFNQNAAGGTSEVHATNCIFRNNGANPFKDFKTNQIVTANNAYFTINYSAVEGGFLSETGNISADPLFADSANADYHLKSAKGRWNPMADGGAGGWVTDTLISPAIDAANTASPFGNEPAPNGNRGDMGFYGNTSQASKSRQSGDANGDGQVAFADYQILESNFGKAGMGWTQGDFNWDGAVNFADYQLLEANFGQGVSLMGSGSNMTSGPQLLTASTASPEAAPAKAPTSRAPAATAKQLHTAGLARPTVGQTAPDVGNRLAWLRRSLPDNSLPLDLLTADLPLPLA